MIFRYTCEKSECASLASSAAAFKDSDLGRSYISLLEPLVRASLIKNFNRLKRAKRRVTHLEEEVRRIWESCKPTQDLVELRNLILVAKLVVDASIDRKENIGLHYNQDLED